MSKLTIVANIFAKPDQVDLVRTELAKLIAPTLAEEGCLQYDLHQDNEDPAHFLFYENWASRDLWLVHMEQPHIKAYAEATEGAVDHFTLHEMTHLD
ncbi:MAG: putative quinol monooxygenase [Verrucomicrobiales bacterium]|jgi:quinol monooxygenase YgiN|nr:putative quinol monooxygenase [Verrucomicrobiales bacterium]